MGAWTALRVSRAPVVVQPFESGSLVTRHAASRYHVRWCTVTPLFLASDMETVSVYPWALVVTEVGVTAVVEMFGFLAVVLVGGVYRRREGALRWT